MVEKMILDERNVPVTTTIPYSVKTEARKQGFTIRSLILRGWESINGDQHLKQRIHAMESGIERLKARLNERDQEVWKLQDALEGGGR